MATQDFNQKIASRAIFFITAVIYKSAIDFNVN